MAEANAADPLEDHDYDKITTLPEWLIGSVDGDALYLVGAGGPWYAQRFRPAPVGTTGGKEKTSLSLVDFERKLPAIAELFDLDVTDLSIDELRVLLFGGPPAFETWNDRTNDEPVSPSDTQQSESQSLREKLHAPN